MNHRRRHFVVGWYPFFETQCTYQISLKSEKLFVDGWTYGCAYWRTFQTPSNVIRSTQRSWPNITRECFLGTMYIYVAYCYRPSSMVCWSACHTSEPRKNGCTDRDAVYVEDSHGHKEPCIRWGVHIPQGKQQFSGGKGRPIVKYRDTLQ